MATPSVLTFDAEGRAVDFEVWLDYLQLFLQCDRADGLSLFDLTSGVSPAPPATADSTVRSQWATRDAAARLAVRRHLPTTERAHFSQYRSAQTLYDAVVARYSSPATAALSRLFLPYLFPDLAAFPTVADLITHLRTSDTRYRAALPAEDHFLSVCPTTLTVDLLEERLLAAEQSIVAVGASRGDPHTPIFEGCSPSPLLPSNASAAAADLGGFESVGAASAPSGSRRTGRSKGGRGARWGGGGGRGGEELLHTSGMGLVLGGRRPVVLTGHADASWADDQATQRSSQGYTFSLGSGSVSWRSTRSSSVLSSSCEAEIYAGAMAAQELCWLTYLLTDLGEQPCSPPVLYVDNKAMLALCREHRLEHRTKHIALRYFLARELQQRGQLRLAYVASEANGFLFVLTSFLVNSFLFKSSQFILRRLTDAWRQQFPEAAEIPRWGELSRAGVAIFDLDFDAILAAMYAVTISDEGDCYRCFPPDPGIGSSALGAGEASALGASASVPSGVGETALSGTCASALSGTASASASLTFTLDSGASRSFFRDRTTLTPLSRPVAVSLADPSGGPVLSRFSTVLPCPAAPSGTLSGLYLPSFSTNLVSGAALQDAGVHQFTPARQRVTHCTEASTGRHLATFTRQPGSSLSGPESAPCSCRRLSHETLLWHHRLGHPSLLRLRGMASRLLVSGLPRSLPPLPPGPGPTCVPCVEGRQRAAPHSS
ncbi:unnamed protein product [Closterium sp. NIES-53]